MIQMNQKHNDILFIYDSSIEKKYQNDDYKSSTEIDILVASEHHVCCYITWMIMESKQTH